VEKADVGEAGGLIQFFQSLGGAVGLSMLASFQQTRFTSLDPSPSAACSSLPPPLPLCANYLASFQGALINSYDQTFMVMFGLLAVSLVFGLFLQGRLPKALPRTAAAPTLESASQGGASEPASDPPA